MKDLRAYQIPFVGLKFGEHHFNFVLESSFFSHFEESLVKEGQVFVDLTFDKKERLFVLNFDISGSIKSECDRCGQPFDLPIHGNYTIYVKGGDIETGRWNRLVESIARVMDPGPTPENA